MLIPKRATVSKNKKSNPSCEKPAVLCAALRGAWCCSAVRGPLLWAGRPPGAPRAIVTAANASPDPWISHWTMVHASPPSPRPPCCHLGRGPTLNNFKVQESNIFQQVAMIFLPDWCHFSIWSFPPSLPPLSTHLITPTLKFWCIRSVL